MCTPISISNDGVVEDTESFTVSLISEDPAVQLTQSTGSVVVNDSSGKLIQAVVHCLVKG